ncbi:MAG: toxin HipA [Rhodospirillaceae bacterium]|nr:MAG: toxin HipA [Rhodospirillaceae bacterium]
MALQVLDVFLHNEFIGKLSYQNGLLSFVYDNGYMREERPLPLSASLPLQGEAFDHALSESFFSGLLPESIIRERLARYLRISAKNTFALLKEIGGECAGAVSVYPEGIRPDTQSENNYRILEEDEAHEIISQLDKRPLMAGEDGIRISGAGAQDKLIVALINGKLAIPKRNTPSTHILKPKIRDLEQTVQNELFCMKLAKRVGLPVPKVEIFYLKGEAYYLVERYDRIQQENGKIQRLHQEDICQALHIPPEQKYESEGGPTLKQCFDLLDTHIREGRMAGVNRMIMLQAVIFNFLIGNGDAHGKNFSILYEGEGEALTPFYDLLCTCVYGDAYKNKMAMKIANKYKFTDVYVRHFERLGEMTGFKASFVRAQIEKIVIKTLREAPKLRAELNNNSKTQSQIYENIIDIIETHCSQVMPKPL